MFVDSQGGPRGTHSGRMLDWAAGLRRLPTRLLPTPTPTSRVHWMQKREQERRSLAGYQVPAPRAPADVRACVLRALNETVSE